MEGHTIPQAVLKTRVRDDSIAGSNPYRWQDTDSPDLFRGKRVVVFSLPGAFTPTCSNRQWPAFELAYEQMRAPGIDEVYCISVNDAFVMHNWAKSLELKNLKLIPDGSGHFTRRMGMRVNKDHFGFGYRSWRTPWWSMTGSSRNGSRSRASTIPVQTRIPMARPTRSGSSATCGSTPSARRVRAEFEPEQSRIVPV